VGSLRLLGHRNFGPYFVGNFLSNCGTWFQTLAQSLLVYRLTNSVFLVGVVNFSQFAGVFILSPWSGHAADRFDRRRLLVATQLGAIAVTGLMALVSASGHATAAVVIVLALVLGLSTAFALPALMALVPALVETEDLGPAIALNSVSFTLARAIGPVIGAFVVGHFGVSTAFALNALSYFALVVALGFIHPRPQAQRAAEPPRLLDGVRIVRNNPRLAALVLVVTAVSVTQDPVSTLTPGFAKAVFHHHDTYAGVLIGAFGLGAAVAGLIMARRTVIRASRLPFAAALMGGSMVVFGLSPSIPVAYVALFCAGLGFLLSNTTATTIVQLEVDDQQRGRVMAIWTVAFLGARPFASLGDGAIANALGLRGAAVVMAVPALLAAVVGGIAVRRRRRGFVVGGSRYRVSQDPIAG
jgi:MFS family permease